MKVKNIDSTIVVEVVMANPEESDEHLVPVEVVIELFLLVLLVTQNLSMLLLRVELYLIMIMHQALY